VRRREVTVDLDELRRSLRPPGTGDLTDWQHMREHVAGGLEASLLAKWIDPLELVGIDGDGTLLLACPERMAGWVSDRYLPLIERCAAARGRAARIAERSQLAALQGRAPDPAGRPIAQGRERRRDEFCCPLRTTTRRGGAKRSRRPQPARASDRCLRVGIPVV
jgi:hypothetical protein